MTAPSVSAVVGESSARASGDLRNGGRAMLLPVEGIETTIAGYLEDTWVAVFANDNHSHL
jgi:hypothetical protein